MTKNRKRSLKNKDVSLEIKRILQSKLNQISRQLKVKFKFDEITLSEAINIVISLIALIVAVITINEIKEDRRLAYKPDILINPFDYSVEWDANGNETWLQELGITEFYVENIGDGTYESTITINCLPKGFFADLPVNNVGIASAKNVIFSWEKNNTERLNNCLIELNSEKEGFCTIGSESVGFAYDEGIVQVDLEPTDGYMYMLPATESREKYDIPIPNQYIILINEIIKTGKYSNSNIESMPIIMLTVSCVDTRDKKLDDKTILLQLLQTSYMQNEDGSGKATYQLAPRYAK